MVLPAPLRSICHKLDLLVLSLRDVKLSLKLTSRALRSYRSVATPLLAKVARSADPPSAQTLLEFTQNCLRPSHIYVR